MRHAYMIIAHDNYQQLRVLLQQLDDERNDIFLHIDKKSTTLSKEMFSGVVNKSSLYIIECPISVFWGDYSIVQCELLMLETATAKGNYSYYHLLSGICMAIKSQDYIHDFFQKNAGKEFVSLYNEQLANRVRFRYKYYFPYMRLLKNPKAKWTRALMAASSITQKVVGINRTRKNKTVVFGFGAQWFSITDRFARYVIGRKAWIETTFRHTLCADEVFLQTILLNSEFAENVYTNSSGDNSMRLIDWNRGRPYVFCEKDIDEVMSSPMLFARKLDLRIDSKIVDAVLKKTLSEVNVGESEV